MVSNIMKNKSKQREQVLDSQLMGDTTGFIIAFVTNYIFLWEFRTLHVLLWHLLWTKRDLPSS